MHDFENTKIIFSIFMNRFTSSNIMNIKSIFAVLKNSQIYKFAISGAIGSIIVLLITAILTSLFGIFYAISTIIALEISTTFGFFINDRWAFSGVIKKTKITTRLLKNNLVAFIGFGINEAILIFLTNTLGLHYLLSEGIAIVLTFVFNFVTSKKFTWRN